MADGEESSSSEDSEGLSTSSSSEDLQQACSDEATPGNQDREPSASSSQRASRREVRTWNSARLIGRPENPPGAEARGGPSAESSAKSGGQPKLPMPKLDLRALFDYHSRRKQRRRRRCRLSPPTEAATKYKSPEPCSKRPRLRASKEKQRKRPPGKYLQFPFVRKLYGKEHIPLRMECLFEQATVQGFFKYIEKLKFEHHLKKSLAEVDATEDLEKESLDSRRHKYLDDDGPLSPIEEGNGEDVNEDRDTEDVGARIVENSVFILSSNIPEKKSRKTNSSVPQPLPSNF
ncbi:PREDICTED: TATA box-binding protein-associated factor RNA polymerase I subunit D isoform X2 [Gekko japonicus]|uniref:TATA box-binding protein-associated factor RNA polymerase I subunit D n=1 Tax=Gekko japonicus TaxID=146911 RepID=A0ABM1JWD8_GEKJA|nr:PREDICTED: TATA box-binding protein-associated factor RNA polymerase I subunit D isoform X2 [Gekko japonicus]XP_015265775.1 PREDICTED: TATA box-binding protein-associated factor RNA polymerase I subunit D isoform X2 [Gekko japonicus]